MKWLNITSEKRKINKLLNMDGISFISAEDEFAGFWQIRFYEMGGDDSDFHSITYKTMSYRDRDFKAIERFVRNFRRVCHHVIGDKRTATAKKTKKVSKPVTRALPKKKVAGTAPSFKKNIDSILIGFPARKKVKSPVKRRKTA